MNPKLKIVLLLAIAMSLFIIFCDSPNEPDEEEPEEHLFYIAPRIGNMVKVFSVEQEGIVDSFVIDSVEETWQMRLHVIGDDSILAVSSNSKTFEFDLETKMVIETFPREYILFSRNSKYYLTYIPVEAELYSYPGHALVSNQIGSIYWAQFDNQSQVLSYSYSDSINGQPWPSLGYYDIANYETHNHTRYYQGIPVATLFSMVSLALEKIYLFTSYPSFGFGVTDLDSDTIRYLMHFGGMGKAVLVLIDPSSEYVFQSDFGLTSFGDIPTEHIFVYDAESEDSVAAIAYQGLDMVDYMVISYDSKYLMARPYNEYEDITSVCLIDAVNFEVIGVYDCGFLPGSITAKYAARNAWSL